MKALWCTFLFSCVSCNPEASYKISYIPFDVDFFNGTGPNDFKARSWSEKPYNSKALDELFSKAEEACAISPEYPPDLRVKILAQNGDSLFVDSEKKFYTANKLCDFDPQVSESIILEIIKLFPETNNKSGSEIIKEKMGEEFPQ